MAPRPGWLALRPRGSNVGRTNTTMHGQARPGLTRPGEASHGQGLPGNDYLVFGDPLTPHTPAKGNNHMNTF